MATTMRADREGGRDQAERKKTMDLISYEQFGVNFVAAAVTVERIEGAIGETSGDPVDVGPMPAGPGGIATVRATGQVGTPVVHKLEGPTLKFDAVLPIELQLDITVAAVPQRFSGEVEVPLSLSVHTAAPLTLLIEVAPVVPREIRVDLASSGLGAGVIQKVGNVDDEVRKQVAKVVNDRIGSERARASRVIDVGEMIQDAISD